MCKQCNLSFVGYLVPAVLTEDRGVLQQVLVGPAVHRLPVGQGQSLESRIPNDDMCPLNSPPCSRLDAVCRIHTTRFHDSNPSHAQRLLFSPESFNFTLQSQSVPRLSSLMPSNTSAKLLWHRNTDLIRITIYFKLYYR